MVTEIRIYIEGGGESRDTKAFLRQGFSEFLRDLVFMARNRNVRWQIVMCGTRNAAFEGFKISLRQHPEAFNVLLIDSEAPVQTTPWNHLQQREQWQCPSAQDENCHLMVQTMEAWFLADIDALGSFYGANFNRNAIPRNPDVEQVNKAQLEASLKAATRGTQKGEYHKIRHAYKLLAEVNVEIVRHAARHCDRLFVTLAGMMT